MTRFNMQEHVHNWRQKTGNKQRQEKYHFLREKGLPAETANEMKFWSWGRIHAYFMGGINYELDPEREI